jgi:hypothetical protein
MTADQYLRELREHAADARRPFSNAGRAERERMIVRAFLRCLKVPFTEGDIAPGAAEPVHVAFQDARFQIMEIVGEKKRGRDWKDRERRYHEAQAPADLLEPYASPTRISFSEISRLVAENLARKFDLYGGAVGTATLDALVYVNLPNANLFPTAPVMEPQVADALKRQSWRSVSILFAPYGVVLAANAGAPRFLSERVGLTPEPWSEPFGLFDA